MNRFFNRYKNSLMLKVFFSTSLLLILISFLIFGILQVLVPKTVSMQQSQRIEKDLPILLEKLSSTDVKQSKALLTSFSIQNQSDLELLDEKNQVVSSVKAEKFSSNHQKAKTYVISSNFKNNGHNYSLLTTFSGELVNQVTEGFQKVFPYLLMMIALVALLLALLYSKIIVKPIVKLSHLSKKMSHLDFTEPIEMKRTDEIGVLAEHLNQLAKSLDSAMEELKLANEKLISDIDQEKKQAQQRKDFFTAISHELKTPLAVLQGKLEGMIGNIGKFKDRETYLKEAYASTKEMEQLIKELTLVAKLNSNGFELERKKLSINEMIQQVISFHEKLARSKHLKFIQTYETNFTYNIDEIKFKMALSNIMGNAIHYSPFESTITIKIKEQKDQVLLWIENLADSINQEELDKVFQPFYRIDKSRSRYTGGSGLGLYIVKIILESHEIKYKLQSTPNTVRFTMVFEKQK